MTHALVRAPRSAAVAAGAAARPISALVWTLFLSLALLAGFAATPPAKAAEPAVYSQNGLALGGYDPVAYFTEGRPVEGSAQFTAAHQGAIYRFATAANRDLFAAAPARYAPQYGGYCAYAVANNQLAPGRPQFWRIVDGKLYLNVNAGAQRRWLQDIPGNIAKATANWPKVLEKQSGFFRF